MTENAPDPADVEAVAETIWFGMWGQTMGEFPSVGDPDRDSWIEKGQAAIAALRARGWAPRVDVMDLVAYLTDQRAWSEQVFGPGERTAGNVEHIRRELREIEASPKDVEEWIDVAMLALDGAWRIGFSPEQIATALQAKLDKNKARKWPDWRTADLMQPIEHIRAAAGSPQS